MRSVVRLSVVLGIAVGLVAPAAARDIFVSNTGGDDSFTGRQARSMPDRSGPVRTIAKALRLARQGDRIVLAKTDLPYRESISLVGSRRSGSSLTRFVIAGNGAVLDGSAPVPPDAWEHYRGAVFRFRPPGLEHQQLFLDDRPAMRVVISRLAGTPPELEDLQWCLHEGYIYFRVEPLKLPEDYALTYADKRVGITLFHVDQVAILDLTVQGFQLDGVNAANTARNIYLAGVTCRGNGRSGITVGGASLVALDAALLGNNGQAQLLTLPFSETHVYNSELLSNTAPAWVDQGGRFYLEGKRITGGLDELTKSQ